MTPQIAVFLVGISGILSEVVIIREFLNLFLGNEFTIGTVLSFWLLSESLGAFVFEKIDIDPKVAFFILQLAFIILFPGTIFAIRLSRIFTGIGYGEVFSMGKMIELSFFLPFLLSFSHGALFTVCCRFLFGGKTYVIETAGTMVGGFFATYLFVASKNPMDIAFLASILAFFSILLVEKRYAIFGFIPVLLFFFSKNSLEGYSISKKWYPQKVKTFKESPYGRIVVAEREGELTLYFDGVSSFSYPIPDIASLEFFSYIPILLSKNPERVLVVGGGTGDILKVIESIPYVKKIVCVEIDPCVKEISERIWKGFNKTEFVFDDGRRYLRRCDKKFDVIISDVFEPKSLKDVRFFTDSFFKLAKKRLNPGGVLAVKLPLTFPYLSEYVSKMDLSILKSMSLSFKNISIFPEEGEVLYVGSLKRLSEDHLMKRLAEVNTEFLSKSLILYSISLRKWFLESQNRVRCKKNTDLFPISLYYYLLFWSKKYSIGLHKLLLKMEAFSQKALLFSLIIPILFSILFFVEKRKRVIYLTVPFLFLTGFISMAMSLCIMFLFQMEYGSLYSSLGAIFGAFMGGAVLGGLFSLKRGFSNVILADGFVTASCAVLAIFLLNTDRYLGFIIISAISGVISGIEYPIFSNLFEKEKVFLYGTLYASDLSGAFLSGLLVSSLFIPCFGIRTTIFSLIVVKGLVWVLASIFIFLEEIL